MSDERRHDLDALRAAAMLLGIAYHAALSFAAGMPWFVQDTRQTVGLYYFESASHGFRMPLFFLISGFFTAMLWQKRGLRGLWANRLTRILLPCLLGLVTIVPLTNWSIGLSIRNQMQRAAAQQAEAAAAIPSVWLAVAQGNVPQLQAELAAGLDTATLHPQFGTTLLAWSALHGQVATTEALLAGRRPTRASPTWTVRPLCTARVSWAVTPSSPCCWPPASTGRPATPRATRH